MSEERFLFLFNDLDKVLRRVCQVPDDQYMDVGSLLLKARDLSDSNPVKANWDQLYVARQLRNLIVHEKRTALKEVAHPSAELLMVLEEVIDQYRHPKTVWDFLRERGATRPIWFDGQASLREILAVVHKQHFSQFPIFNQEGYCHLVTENGITNWLAQVSQSSQSLPVFDKVRAQDILAFEEQQLVVERVSKEASLYDLISLFEETGASLVLVCHRKDGRLQTGQDLAGLVTAYDVTDIYRQVEDRKRG